MPHAEINGQSIHYEDSGGDGPAIVFSHGFFMSGAMFEPQVEALKDRYRCITWDERGHGQTVTSPEPFSYWDSADDLVGLLDHLGIDQAVMAGMSQGGFLSLRAALAHPSRARALILIDSQPGPENPETLEGYNQMIAAWTAPGGPPQEIVDTVGAIILGAGFDDPSWMEVARNMEPDTVNQIYATLTSRDDVTPRLGEIGIPVLVIHGDQDVAISIDVARAYVTQLPDGELVEVEGAGHAANLSHPEPTNAAIEAFLARL
ncbi:MAG: alpha/beta fold hydrolase [Solirubrobacteraceae bacterium]|nr:alpha/beta fold hydrolase [Solirubrobacteraceae bacterium]